MPATGNPEPGGLFWDDIASFANNKDLLTKISKRYMLKTLKFCRY